MQISHEHRDFSTKFGIGILKAVTEISALRELHRVFGFTVE